MPDAARPRDRWLTTLAILMGLMSLSNFWKPFAQSLSPDGGVGFVFFGARLHGTANAIVGPLFGALLAAYAYGVWTMRRWVLPLAFAYAGYVVANMILFMLIEPSDRQPPLAGMLGYAAVAIGVSSGGAYYLSRNRDRLH